MLSERMLSAIIRNMMKRELAMKPTVEKHLPGPQPNQRYMLYMHVPFCQVLCPYCSFNRYPYREEIAKPYFASMRKEMLMLADLGYDFESIYVGGGTPTIMLDELCETLDLARDTFHIREVASETNPNHLVQPYLDKLQGRVNRLSVGVQSFDDGLLKQMDRYNKYGSGEEIFERIGEAAPFFNSLNVDMIFNFPSQTEDILFADLEKIAQCGARQTTFSPLYASNGTVKKMEKVLGKLDFDKERRFYQIIDGVLAEAAPGEKPLFDRTTLWTFTRAGERGGFCGAMPAGGDREGASSFESTGRETPQIDEYQVSYVEYPGIGSGSISSLNGCLYVNTFSIEEYNARIARGEMSLMGRAVMSKRDLMRYSFLLALYQLRLDKRAFKEEFGTSLEAGLPMEMAFMRLNGAFATDNEEELTLTARGRYLTVVMYRQFLSGMNNLREQARAALPAEERAILFGDEDHCSAGI